MNKKVGPESKPSLIKRILPWSLMLIGTTFLLFGLHSCLQYEEADAPPEMSQPGWDGDAHAEPYIALTRFIYIMSTGAIALFIGLYLHMRSQAKSASPGGTTDNPASSSLRD